MKRHVAGNVWWVGKVDWELKRFHGSEYSTHRGSSYNSYLIREEKTVLVDTVWQPFSREYVANLESEAGLKNIDFIVQNHAENDHSGALPELLRLRPDLPIYCTANCVKSLKGIWHGDWDFHVVKTGDSIDIGNGKRLVFVEAQMLHWPDSMFTYLTGDAILFSNDAFGQHYASEALFNDLVAQDELWAECIKYYANILTPFSALVTRKIDEVLGMNIPVKAIATSHGIIWRKDPLQIVEKYSTWARDYREDRIAILYDSMWDGTRKLAEALAQGIIDAAPTTSVVVVNTAKTDKNDVITEVFRSKAILVGSPTINRGILSSVAGVLEIIEGLRFKGKKAASFGCSGWSGEAPKKIAEWLGKSGFEIVCENHACPWEPDETALASARTYGAAFARQIQ